MEFGSAYAQFAEEVDRNKAVWRDTKSAAENYKYKPSVKISLIDDDIFFADPVAMKNCKLNSQKKKAFKCLNI